MQFQKCVKTMIDSPNALAQIAGQAVREITPLAGGTVSPVYQLTLADGERRVLKFGEEEYTLQVERLFLERWAKAGIHTPTIFQQDVFSLEESTLYYLLMEALPGENLFPLMELGQLDNAVILRDLGRILARMHECCAAGYGEIQLDSEYYENGEVCGKLLSLAESLAGPDWVTAIEANQANNDLNVNEQDLVPLAISILEKQRDDLGSSFAHNDFRAGNIIYHPTTAQSDSEKSGPEKSDVSQPYAVIDPGAELTHPYLCLAYSLLLEEVHGANDPADFRRGYEEITPLDETALHAAMFLRTLLLLPRWGQAGQPYAEALRSLFRREIRWLRGNF